MDWFKKNKPEVVLGLIIVFYIILFSYLSIHRVLSLNSHYYDLGIMNQTVYNTSRGYFLEMTNQEFRKNISRLAVHFDPILAVFAPLYWLYPGPEVLLIVQTLVLASGALAIFLISQKILKNKLMSLIFAASYLLFFPVQRANLFDFHAVVLATSFLLWMIYFSLEKKRIATIVFVILALLTKEHVGLIIFLFGGYLFLFKKERKFGLLVALLGLIFFLFSFFLVIPYFRQQTHFALKYYTDFGETPTQVILGVLKKPSLTIKYLLQPESRQYLSRLFLPHLPYILFSPIEVLISLPELVINILSANGNMRSIYFHYNSLIIPFIFFAAISGAAKIKKSKLRFIVLILFIYLSWQSTYRFTPLPLSFLKEPYKIVKLDHQKLQLISKWKNIFADDEIKISTTPKLAPFFTDRHYYYNFLYDPGFSGAKIPQEKILERINKYNQADYVIIDREEIHSLNEESLMVTFYKDLVLNKSFKRIFKDNKLGIEVYKKI